MRQPFIPNALRIALVSTVAIACGQPSPHTSATPSTSTSAPSAASSALLPGPQPKPARPEFVGLLGEYTTPNGMRVVRENLDALEIVDTTNHIVPLTRQRNDNFVGVHEELRRLIGIDNDEIHFERGADGRATSLDIGGQKLPRLDIEPAPGTSQLRVTPVRPVEEVRKEALAASPPAEKGDFRAPELVELVKLDPTIRLEIRYATTNNFLGTKFYDEARAFMQRPAAEAVVRANQALRPLGYGLLIHDAYRPWYVTKMFWDATPTAKRWLVANPAQGSKHNRGSAVDLTLFDLKTGQPISMPSTYDESTDRAYADYPGGTSLQRWDRLLLRRAMEAQGFAVNPTEWWHFDYSRWREYGIGNIPFDKIGR